MAIIVIESGIFFATNGNDTTEIFDLENANGLCPNTFPPVGASRSVSQSVGFMLGKTPVVCKQSSCYAYQTTEKEWKLIVTSTSHQLGFSHPIVVDSTTAILAAGTKDPSKTSFVSLDGTVSPGPKISRL